METVMSKGFTLIELIITLSIASILMGYGIPSMQEFTKNQTMATERSRLLVDMSFARYTAINTQQYVVVCPSISGKKCDTESNWHNGWMVFTDANLNRKKDADDMVLRFDNTAMKNITAISSKYRSKIRFDALGHSPGTNVTINFCDDRKARKGLALVINNAGRAKEVNSKNACT